MVSRSKEDGLEQLDKLTGYSQLKYIDQLTAVFPTTYIIAPTTNAYTIIKGAKIDEILQIVQELSIAKKKYFNIRNLYLGDQKSKNESDLKDLESLERLFTVQRDSIIELTNRINLMKQSQKSFYERILDEFRKQME